MALDEPCLDARGTPVAAVKYATHLDDVTTGDPDLEECWQQIEIVVA